MVTWSSEGPNAQAFRVVSGAGPVGDRVIKVSGQVAGDGPHSHPVVAGCAAQGESRVIPRLAQASWYEHKPCPSRRGLFGMLLVGLVAAQAILGFPGHPRSPAIIWSLTHMT